jgi:hypothetical protein
MHGMDRSVRIIVSGGRGGKGGVDE